MTRKELRTRRHSSQKRVFIDKLFHDEGAQMLAATWATDMEDEGWTCSRVSKLGLDTGRGPSYVALLWKWVDA